MMKMRVTAQAFESIRERGALMSRTYYVLPREVGFCPDGVGMVWYNTFDEAEANHG